jgi:hypothetical protein
VTPQEAKEILLLYRPGTTDAEEPQVAEAMAVARQDPELAGWFEQHSAFQQAMKLRFRQIEVPEHLKLALLGGQKVLHYPSAGLRSNVIWLAAAAAFLITLGIANLLLRPTVPDRFENFRDRMVSTALREYRMDIVTNDMGVLRQTLEAKGAPADYQLSHSLQNLQLTGGAALTWRNHPVSMVCFDRGNKSMVFLFVMKSNALKNPPPTQPRILAANNLYSASWSQGDNTYLMLGSPSPGFPGKFLE